MKTNLIITLFVVLMSMGGYAQTKGNGVIKSQDRDIENFTAIKLTCSADLHIVQGKTALTVKTDENLLELIETEVENGTLYISVKGRGFRSAKGLDVYITMPTLEKLMSSGSGDVEFGNTFKGNDIYISISGSGDIDGKFDVTNLELKVNGSGDTEISGIMGMLKLSVSGSGDIDADGLKLDECNIRNSGSGDISLTGKTNKLTVSQNGSGDLSAYHFTAVSAVISNSGSSDMTLHVVENLKVTLNGSGDLTYQGNPEQVDVRTNGSGDIYKK